MPRAVLAKRIMWAGLAAAVVVGLGFVVFLMPGPVPSTEDAAPAPQVTQPVPEVAPVEQPQGQDVKEALEGALKGLADESFRAFLRKQRHDYLTRAEEADPYSNPYRRLAAIEVEYETPEEMVANLRAKMEFWEFATIDHGAGPLLKEIGTDPRVQRLLAIAWEGTEEERQAILDQVKEMCRIYLEELPDFVPRGQLLPVDEKGRTIYPPNVCNDPGGLAYPYLLAHLDEEGATLELVVNMFLRLQDAALKQRASDLPEAPPPIGGWIGSNPGLMLAYAAADALGDYLARPELQENLQPAQLEVLESFQAYLERHENEPNYDTHQFTIMRMAVDFVEGQE